MIIKKIGVIGAGQMGNGIAHVCALARLFDVAAQRHQNDDLEHGARRDRRNLSRQVGARHDHEGTTRPAMKRIRSAPRFDAFGDCDLVIEAATEDESVKRKIFQSCART